MLQRIALICLLASCVRASAEEAKENEVVQAWKQRQDAVQTLDVKWLQSRTDLRDGMSAGLLFVSRKNKDADVVFPEVDTTYDTSFRLWRDQKRTRIDFKGTCWRIDERRLVPRIGTAAFDGKVSRSVHEGMGPEGRAKCLVAGELAGELQDKGMLPVIWTYYPLDVKRGGSLSTWISLAGETAHINGHDCVKVFDSTRTGNAVELWADPASGYVVRRAIYHQGEDISRQIDITYDGDFDGIPKLASWRLQEFSSDLSLEMELLCKVDFLELNAPIDLHRLEVSFPLDGFVVDVGKQLAVPPQN